MGHTSSADAIACRVWLGVSPANFSRKKRLVHSISNGVTVFGGAGKFFWFLPMLVTMCPPKMGQFFVDQVQHFVMTHGITAETAPMPRA